MIKVRKDLTGKRFGRTTVIKQSEEDHIFPSGRKAAKWICRCDCGKEHVSLGWDLTSGDTISCGCYRKECELKNLSKYAYEKKYNKYDLMGEYGVGYTNKSEPFYFDLEDYDKIKDYCWSYNSDGYVVARGKDNSHIKLHRLIMDVVNPDLNVDHIKHPPRKEHKIDNRKSNLRIATSDENACNTSLSTANTSGIKGVYFIIIL